MVLCFFGIRVVAILNTACAAVLESPGVSCPSDAIPDDFQFVKNRQSCSPETMSLSYIKGELTFLLQTARRKHVEKNSLHKRNEQLKKPKLERKLMQGYRRHFNHSYGSKTLHEMEDVQRKYNGITLVEGWALKTYTEWMVEAISIERATNTGIGFSQKPGFPNSDSKVVHEGTSWKDSHLWFTRVGLVVFIFTAIIFFAFHVAAGSRANEAGSRPHRPLQTVLLLYICMFMSSVTVIIPASSALMHDLGLGATSSGVLIGCAWPLSSVVAFLMKPLVQDWDQSRVRLVLLVNYALQVLSTLAFALASDPPAAFGTVSDTARLAVFFISRLIVGVSGGSDLLLNVMVWKIVPAKEIVSLEVNKTYCRILAIGLGPLVFSLVCWTTGASNPRTHSAHPAYAFSVFWLIFGIIASVSIPKKLTSLKQAKEAEDDRSSLEGVSNKQENSFNVRALPETTRRSIWFAAMFYGFERALMVSALEAATSLIIEIEFSWNIKDVGLAVSMTFFIGLPFALLLNITRESGLITEARLMSGAAVTSVVASLLLFPSISLARALEAHGLSAVGSVLVADCFIFTSRYLANGIIDGLAVQSSLPGTFCSMENFRLFESLLQDSLARFIGPILARYLISSHGRQAYSIMQLCVSTLGCLTCFSIASKMWLPEQHSSLSSTDK